MQPIRVLLADDHIMVREGTRRILEREPDLEVVGEAGDGRETIDLVAETHPDVVVMDISMPVMNGIEATKGIKRLLPQTAVLVLTAYDDDEYVFDGLRAGALGYLLKDVHSEKLLEAIRAAARGESFLQPSVAAKVVAEFSRLADHPSGEELIEPLSEREREVLQLLSSGASNREIAEVLVIAQGTVKNHVTSILGKLGVRDRTQAAIKARELGLV